ncbi:PREDICTED: thyrotropin-releasing hormone-degrading ectoenzyme-like isoform X2 [Vollenhovia emeryi]|uniref:thyrotropin-releasing hormone-degrading ectoenzyme-like isoform X2 n=1 Tax=Vollenhovia emeryi TaxID=411798 RepID=UPI0005F4D9F7|nr:PREDICTED: thyrotropin-releasing hormone-degrading ectoenzyme-like isoform X2 [Vollenhovia emeryi]
MSTWIWWIIYFCTPYVCANINETEKHELLYYVIPVTYEVKLNLSTIENGFFDGSCSIDIRLDQPTDYIKFHSSQSQIKIQTLMLRPLRKKGLPSLNTTHHEHKNDIMTIYFTEQLPRGIYALFIKFSTSLFNDEVDLFKTSNTNENGNQIWLLASLNRMTGARRIFPCWDQSTFKATFKLFIQHLGKHEVLTNMPVNSTTTLSDITSVKFAETPLIPPYLIMILITDASQRPVKEVSFYYRQQTASLLNYAETIIENITLKVESQWKPPIELEKIYHVAVPSVRHDSINNLGFNLYREAALIYDEKLDTITHKIDVARIITRTIFHQCFYNSTSYSSWSNLWFTEGMVMLLTIEAINNIQQESLRLDTNSIMKPLASEAYDPELSSLSPFSYYIKAPVIMRMLHHVVGHKMFWDVIEKLFNKRQNIPFIIDDFWDILLILYPSHNQYIFNVRNKMNPWIQLINYPVLNVVQQKSSQVKIFVKSTLYQSMGIPVTFTTLRNPNFNNMRPNINMWITSSNKTIYIQNSTDWIIINTQQAGYYRVNYDAVLWKRIIQYLTTLNHYTYVHVINRAQIIDDAFYFLMNDQLPLYTFLNLTKYLERVTDYVAWYPMLKALEHMSGFFLFEESISLKAHMQDIIHELFTKLISHFDYGKEKPNDLNTSLSQEAAKWACILGDLTCQRIATQKLQQHLSKNFRILPGWKEWAYCNGILPSDIWWDVLNLWIKSRDNKLLEYLSCNGNSSIIINYLRFDTIVKGRIFNVQPNDYVNSFLPTVAKHAKDDVILEYMLQNFSKLVSSEFTWYSTLINIMNHVRSEEQLDKILEFVKNDRKFKVEKSIFIVHFDDKHRLNRQVYEIVNNVQAHMDVVPLLIVKQKRDRRLFEIENQLHYFRRLMLS